MSRYVVVWTQNALEELAEIWTEADDLPAITSAAHAVDRELSEQPADKGTTLSEGLRALVIPPIRILFSADEATGVVEVAKVRSHVH